MLICCVLRGCFPAHPRKPRAGRAGWAGVPSTGNCLGSVTRSDARILGYHRLQAEVANPGAVLRAGLTSAHVTDMGTLRTSPAEGRERPWRREEGSSSGCVVRVCADGQRGLTRSVGRWAPRGFVGPVSLPAPRWPGPPPPISGSGVTAGWRLCPPRGLHPPGGQGGDDSLSLPAGVSDFLPCPASRL